MESELKTPNGLVEFIDLNNQNDKGITVQYIHISPLSLSLSVLLSSEWQHLPHVLTMWLPAAPDKHPILSSGKMLLFPG